jgi:hypothetical protein
MAIAFVTGFIHVQAEVFQQKLRCQDAEEAWAAYRSVLATYLSLQQGMTMAIEPTDAAVASDTQPHGQAAAPEASSAQLHREPAVSMQQAGVDIDRTAPRRIHKVGLMLDTATVENLMNSSQQF